MRKLYSIGICFMNCLQMIFCIPFLLLVCLVIVILAVMFAVAVILILFTFGIGSAVCWLIKDADREIEILKRKRGFCK